MATYHVTHNAAGGGDGSWATPWTLQEAADNAVAGAVVGIHNTGVYSEAAQIDFDVNSGSATQFIQFIGVGAGETDGPEMVTVSLTGNIHGFYVSTKAWLYFENIDIVSSSAGQSGFYIIGAGTDHLIFVNCKSHGHGMDGWQSFNMPGLTFIGCEAYSNGRFGYLLNGDTEQGATLWGCAAHHNVNDGFYVVWKNALIGRCAAYGNGGDGIYVNAGPCMASVVGCVSMGNTDNGIYITPNADGQVHVFNNISVRNGDYGARTSIAGTDVEAFGNLWPASGADANTLSSTFFMDILGNPSNVLKPNLSGAQIADFMDYALCYPDLRLDTVSDALGAVWPGIIPITDLCTTTTAAPTTTTTGA